MLGARSFVLAASCAFASAIVALQPSAAPAQTVDLSLNVFYATPMDINSGGSWELVAKSSEFGIAGIEARLKDIATSIERAPRATVNGGDQAGFNIYTDTVFPTYRGLVIGQAPIDPLMGGEEQGAFYGAGQFANGAPNYPGKPAGSNFEGPAFTSLTAPIGIPWATGDPLNNPAWATAARLAGGTFATNVTPSFVAGSSGNVFSSLGTSTTFGNIVLATLTTVVRVYTPSADYNHNGIVDGADYVVWRNTKNTLVPNGTGADGTGNGFIDQADYTLWRSHFGNPSGAGSGGSLSTSAVPEPGSGVLLVLGAILAVGTRRFAPWCLRPGLSPTQSLAVATNTAHQQVIVFCANCRQKTLCEPGPKVRLVPCFPAFSTTY